MLFIQLHLLLILPWYHANVAFVQIEYYRAKHGKQYNAFSTLIML